jgi:hypothetical protein
MARMNDTSPEAERVLREALRKMPFAARWRQMGAIYDTAKVLHAMGVRRRNPSATEEMIREEWLRSALGQSWSEKSRRPAVDRDRENLLVLQEVLAALSRLGIAHAVGGSWASSLLGKMRYTHDADVSVEPFPGKEAAFCASFGEDYYVSPEAVQDAIRRRSSFNVIHFPSGFKVDLFVRKDRPFDLSLLARRQPHPLPEGGGPPITLVTPEDIILLKLEWYRLGGEVSEQQWRDVLGVLEVQAGQLDQAYLDHWAADLGVTDLLQRARHEAGA